MALATNLDRFRESSDDSRSVAHSAQERGPLGGRQIRCVAQGPFGMLRGLSVSPPEPPPGRLRRGIPQHGAIIARRVGVVDDAREIHRSRRFRGQDSERPTVEIDRPPGGSVSSTVARAIS